MSTMLTSRLSRQMAVGIELQSLLCETKKLSLLPLHSAQQTGVAATQAGQHVGAGPSSHSHHIVDPVMRLGLAHAASPDIGVHTGSA